MVRDSSGHNGDPIGNHHHSFKRYHCGPPTNYPYPKLGSQIRYIQRAMSPFCQITLELVYLEMHVLLPFPPVACILLVYNMRMLVQ